MTAPDPGVTDLIAAHELNYESRDRNCLCGHRSWGTDTHAAHVALVVEQHTNGRITELYEQRDNAIEAGLAAIDRAEKAEATIARVRNALPNIEGINPAGSHYDKGWDRGQQILTEHIQSAITGDYTRAALEGEQQ